jgi:hypothetical protein
MIRVWWAGNRGMWHRSRRHAVEDEGAEVAEGSWDERVKD